MVIQSHVKLSYKNDFMIVRGDEVKMIHLSEINTVIIDSTQVSLTSYLLCEFVKRKIKVIFCDEKRNPSSELVGYYGSHDTSNKVRKQIQWSRHSKEAIWTEIVTEKIRKQKELLKNLGKEEAGLLEAYLQEIGWNDETNREGHAAKVYFNALFGMDFTRSADIPVNAALNYGYSILLSAFNREVSANGYLTQLGIFHGNMFNHFNLACDLMEPFRVIVDRKVLQMKPVQFEKNEKLELLSLLDQKVVIDGQNQFLFNAIKIYTKSVLDAINDNDCGEIRFYSLDKQ